jgi:amino acid adenylation domain-containing protein
MFVGVCAQRSAAMVLSVLAIIRAGGAYVPLDPSLPPARLAYQLADCGASIVLYPVHDGRADAAIGQALLWARTETPGFAAPRLVPVGDMPTSAEEAVAPTSAPASGIGASDPAYLIYTSGSSGRPKGAVNTHGGIANRLQWMQGQYGLSATDRVLQKTPFGFDVSVWEFFWPLITDATLIVARPDGHADAAYLVRCVGEMSVSTMHFVPSMLATWLAEPGVTAVAPGGGGSLRQVMASGEALPASVAIRWVRTMPGAALHNLYGPTEAAIDVSHWTVPVDFAGAVVPIGAPVANTTLHVLDAAGCAVPVGVPGELWIGGVQVGAGYHGRPALTAERFVPDPAHSGGRRYRTGDRVRWRRDGQLEFLGRLDDQVKLRGHRIELGEVESVLLSQPGIREAAVVVQEVVTGHPQLVAFVCGDGTGEAFDALALQRTLTAQLPAVMVPAHVVPMQALPRLASGKVDRRALPAVEAATGTEHDAPGSPTEAAMAAIWRAVLDRTVVGRHDNFFALGGDSLLAMQVLARITSTVRPGLSMRDFFLHPTVAALAACVPEADTAALPPLQPVVATASAPLSYEQRPWWVREQLGMAAAAPAPVAFRLDGALHVDALRMALLEVLGRHDILRTVFREVDGEVQQVVLAPESSTLSLPLTDRTGSDVSCLPDLAAALVEEPMRLDRGPLLRMHLVRLAADEHVLLCSMHHIIMDGVSLGVMAADLAAAYTATLAGEAPAWTPLAVQYRDVSHWQAALLSSPAAAAMVDYWRTHLADVPRLALPTDRPRRGARFARAQLTQTWTPELLQAVDAAAARTGSTRFVVLQSALKAMLHRESGQDDICIGTAVSTRVLPALEPQIGPHMNVLVLRDRVQPDDRFDALVARVRQTTVEGFGRRLVPFDLVVESLRQRREPGRQPVFDVGFTLQNQPSPVWPAGQGLTLTTLGDVLPTSGDAEALTDLWFIARPVGDSLAIDLVFNAALFSHATADRFLSNWQRLLTAAAEPSLVVGTVPLRRRPTRAATPAISIVLSTT